MRNYDISPAGEKAFFPASSPRPRCNEQLLLYLTGLFAKRCRADMYLSNRLMILFKRDRSERQPPFAKA